jgi:hypothetical protein
LRFTPNGGRLFVLLLGLLDLRFLWPFSPLTLLFQVCKKSQVHRQLLHNLYGEGSGIFKKNEGVVVASRLSAR